MIQFSKLRLSGFKSFVDKTELEIGPGLNGIVGPNGCGKSNLVEALRWVMGENSAKRMRGSGMEDVIFSGTGKRSARNFAEVSLLLDNNTRQAPDVYNTSNEIEVTRKIERDKGSGYKINGKNARARDVQMLFADTVTGANSPSLVSQGHVTRMINAKPQDRRLILEESAGIAGLYARRHEAELRLKSADTNLLRVEDIVLSMEGRLGSLKRQARQASKYKNISAQIRQLELVTTYLEWRILVDKQKEIKDNFAKAESMVAQKLVTVTQLTKTQNTQIEELPPLRKKEAEISARLQKNKLDLQRLEEEAARYKNDLIDTKTQNHQTQIDLQHEEQLLEESTGLLERAEIEHCELLEEQENARQSHNEKLKIKDELKIKVIKLEERYTALKENAAESRAREQSLEKQIERNNNRMNILLGRKDNAIEAKAALVIDANSQQMINDLEDKTLSLESELQELNGRTDKSRLDITKAEEQMEVTRLALSTAQKTHTEFNSEISMLEQFFQNDDDEDFAPILDLITTKAGFEKPLSRAIGAALMASLDDGASTNWRIFNNKMEIEELPNGAEPLLPNIDAPKELSLALSQIGFVRDKESGEKLAHLLKSGQSLVSSDGFYWRWDGYHVQSHATDSHFVHLQQKNKLMELMSSREEINEALELAQDDLDKDISDHSAAKQHYDELLSNIKEREAKLKELRPALQKIKEKNLRTESEHRRYDDQIRSINEDIAAQQEVLDKDKISLEALIQSQSEGEHSDELIIGVKIELDNIKEQYQDSVRAFDMLEQAQSTRSARLQAIADERVSLKNRSVRAKERLVKLNERAKTLSEKLSDLENNPVNAKTGHEDILALISDLEKQRADASDALVGCENEVAATSKALKEAENILGNEREARAHANATLSAVNEQLCAMEAQIEDELEMRPSDLINHAAMDLANYQASDLPKLKQDKDKLNRERDNIGSVNLCAEGEANELEAELTTLLNERGDLTQAIDELRGAIAKINKEARERLNIAFDHVNAHFQRLFVRLFDGGKAYLKLIESDDPINAGLEIFAQPPGKAVQSMSLMSGGEQTLTSIALIFAMFLTNPSPICVLDEIDAPLDDANVDRVCNLLDEIAERGETRFLVITHHRLSMARMDRLYGVTMSEKGISQLVSVDLQQSFGFIDKKVA